VPRSRSCAAAFVLAAFLMFTGQAWAQNDALDDQNASPRLSAIRTFFPGDFRESRLDRLSGGLKADYPYRMVMDGKGRVFVTDPALSLVHVFDTESGRRWQITGGFHHGLVAPAYIAVDAEDNVYISDPGQAAVLVFQRNGQFLRSIGSGELNVPAGVWVDKSARTLYVADWWKSQIFVFDFAGNLMNTLGTRGAGFGQLRGPGDIVIHDGVLVVLDTVNSRFELFDLQGNFLNTWPFGADRTPIAFSFDGTGNLFYVDQESGGLVETDPQGNVLARLDQVRDYGQSRPRGVSFRCVAIDPMGNVMALRPTLRFDTVKLVSAPTAPWDMPLPKKANVP